MERTKNGRDMQVTHAQPKLEVSDYLITTGHEPALRNAYGHDGRPFQPDVNPSRLDSFTEKISKEPLLGGIQDVVAPQRQADWVPMMPFGGTHASGQPLPVPRMIKDLSHEDRPREKLLARGASALTDVETLALIVASGNREMSVIDLCKALLDQVGGLTGLGQLDLQELLALKGIGLAKASSILAAFELGRRAQVAAQSRERFISPYDAALHLRARLMERPLESFSVLFLNRGNLLITEREVFKGGLNSVTIDPREIFRYAIQVRASKVILAHNHPSGDPFPSAEDFRVTDEFLRLSDVVGIGIADHVIVATGGYFSMADAGCLDMLLNSTPNFTTMARSFRRCRPWE